MILETTTLAEGFLFVAETFGHRLTAFDLEPDGPLSHRRVWADLEGAFPDGVCLDAGGSRGPGGRTSLIGRGPLNDSVKGKVQY